MEDTFDFGMMRGGITFCGVYDGHAGTRAVNVGTSSTPPWTPSLPPPPQFNTPSCSARVRVHGAITTLTDEHPAAAALLPTARVNLCSLPCDSLLHAVCRACTDAQG